MSDFSDLTYNEKEEFLKKHCVPGYFGGRDGVNICGGCEKIWSDGQKGLWFAIYCSSCKRSFCEDCSESCFMIYASNPEEECDKCKEIRITG